MLVDNPIKRPERCQSTSTVAHPVVLNSMPGAVSARQMIHCLARSVEQARPAAFSLRLSPSAQAAEERRRRWPEEAAAALVPAHPVHPVAAISFKFGRALARPAPQTWNPEQVSGTTSARAHPLHRSDGRDAVNPRQAKGFWDLKKRGTIPVKQKTCIEGLNAS